MTKRASVASPRAGFTLIELLVASVIASLALALAGMIFTTGHARFLTRLDESGQLAERIRLKHALTRALAGEIEVCEGGRIRLMRAGNRPEHDPEKWLRGRFPGVVRIEFQCFERKVPDPEPVPWTGRFQPDWIEYRALLRGRGGEEEMRGSILK